jgi:hypothetical protein
LRIMGFGPEAMAVISHSLDVCALNLISTLISKTASRNATLKRDRNLPMVQTQPHKSPPQQQNSVPQHAVPPSPETPMRNSVSYSPSICYISMAVHGNLYVPKTSTPQ